MMENLRVLVEAPSYDVEYLVEEANRDGERNFYICGPYLQAEKQNKNNRVYTLEEMVPEVQRYQKEMIKTNRALGELNHPASAEINPERACHAITELTQSGTTFIGKSKVLKTPMGQIVRSLINDNIKLGVSSRALGKLIKDSRNVTGNSGDVVTNFRFITCDVVHDPSVDTAFVSGILESKNYVLKEDGTLEEHYNKLEQSLETLPKHDVNNYIKEQVLLFIAKIKNANRT